MTSIRWSMCAAALTVFLGGCMDDVGEVRAATAWIPTQCQLVGLASLENGDSVVGDVSGSSSSGFGSWDHTTSDGRSIQVFPESVTCRLNGIGIADVMGPALVDGSTGYRAVIQAEDRMEPGESGEGEEVEGATEIQTLTATRTYSPSRWEDDSLDLGGRAIVTIPQSLPVTVGNAGKGWAWITFDRAGSLDTVTCRYRGGAPTPRPRSPEELNAGATYELERCTGEDPGTEPVVAGSRVEVLALSLHVHTGALCLPSSADAQTTVSVDLEVTPIVVTEPRPDHYVLVLFDGADSEVLTSSADVATGDLQVIPLD